PQLEPEPLVDHHAISAALAALGEGTRPRRTTSPKRGGGRCGNGSPASRGSGCSYGDCKTGSRWRGDQKGPQPHGTSGRDGPAGGLTRVRRDRRAGGDRRVRRGRRVALPAVVPVVRHPLARLHPGTGRLMEAGDKAATNSVHIHLRGVA